MAAISCTYQSDDEGITCYSDDGIVPYVMMMLDLLCHVLAAVLAMEYITVCNKPNNCLNMSRLILGTDHLGKVSDTELTSILNTAVELGINSFDTSPIYIQDIEHRLGLWLNSRNRSNLHVITKGGFPKDYQSGATYMSRLNGTREQIVENILEEEIHWSTLNLGHIDIYLMHRDDVDYINYTMVHRPQTSAATIMSALSDTRLTSRYNMVGVSNWVTSRVNEAMHVHKTNASSMYPVINSPYFSLLEMADGITIHIGGHQVVHGDMINPEYEPGIKIAPYSPLGGFSILSRGWDRARQIALQLKEHQTIENWDWHYWQRVFDSIMHDANKQRYERAFDFLIKFNAQHGTHYTMDQLFDAYALAHKRCDFLIVGPTSIEQLQRTVGALELSKMLTLSDLDYLYYNPPNPNPVCGDEVVDSGLESWAVMIIAGLVGMMLGASMSLSLMFFGSKTRKRIEKSLNVPLMNSVDARDDAL